MGKLSECTAAELLDKLIACWSMWESNEDYYLNELAPAIICGSGAGHLSPNEEEIISLLRKTLSAKEWGRLSELIAERRANPRMEIESDRKRLKAKRERRRREEEGHRRREAERLAREREEAEERRGREEALRERKQTLLDRIHSAFDSDFLSADQCWKRHPDRGLLSDAEYLESKVRFIQEWARREVNQSLDAQSSPTQKNSAPGLSNRIPCATA